MEWEWHAGGGMWTMGPATYWATVVLVSMLAGLGLALNAIVLRRAGRHWLWALLFLFPLAYLVGLWVFAFTRWPRAHTRVPIAVGDHYGPVSDRRRW